MDGGYKYDAFISYNSKDRRKARWLQKRLEKYQMPSQIKSLDGEVIKSFDQKEDKLRIFRYETDFVAQNLDDGLRVELNQSKYLIVLCSPNSAKSEWVGKEIRHFVDTGRKKQIIAFTIKGKAYSRDRNECFNPELVSAYPNGSLLGVNWNDCGDDPWLLRKRKAIAKLVSLLIDTPEAFIQIWNRYRLSYVLSLLTKTVLGLLLVLAFALSIKYVINRERSFDVALNLYEVNANPQLPKIKNLTATVSSGAFSQEIIIDDLDSLVGFSQLPGNIRGDSCRLTIRDVDGDCIGVDTVVCIGNKLDIPIHRNIDRFGKIDVIIKVGDEKLCDTEIKVDGNIYRTNPDGHLAIAIPLELQRKVYLVEYKGFTGEIKMPCVGKNQQLILQ